MKSFLNLTLTSTRSLAQKKKTPGSRHPHLPILHRKLPEIKQMDATECGATCLAMILNYYGRKTTSAETRIHCGVGRDGSSAFSIVKAARDYGLRVRAVSLQQNDFRYVTLPAIVHWEFNHFIVIERWSLNYVDVVDPAYGRRRISSTGF